MAADIDIQVDASEFKALLAQSKAFDATLATALRRNVRNAAKDVAAHRKADVLSGSYLHNVGLRAAIAAGIGVAVATGKNPGVSITASSKGLRGGRWGDHSAGLVAAWQNAKGFRHPRFGDKSTWYPQTGHRYFWGTFEQDTQAFAAAMQAAMEQARDEMRSAVDG